MSSYVDNRTTPKGLYNVGATCYMNADLQCFFHVKELTNEILNLGNKGKINSNMMPMTYAFFNVCSSLVSKESNPANPEIFKKVISINPLFIGVQANDSKDLILYILETMDYELTRANFYSMNYFSGFYKQLNPNLDPQLNAAIVNFMQNHNSIVSDLFYAFKFQSVKCVTCGTEFKNYELYNFFIFPIEQVYLSKNQSINNLYSYTSARKKGVTSNSDYGGFYNTSIPRSSKKEISLEDCFEYEKKEYKFVGENQIFCNKCQKMRDANQKNQILYSPHIMIIILNRGKANQFDCDVKFNNTFDTSKFIENKSGPTNYDLIGVISHYGESGMGGHFIAECKHFDGRWYSFSDAQVSRSSNNYSKGGVPYILFYRSKTFE